MPTCALKEFFDSRQKIFDLTYALAMHAPKGVDPHGAGKDLLTQLFISDPQERAKAAQEMEQRLQTAFGGQLSYFFELIFCRLVDTFEIYVSDLLLEAYKLHPNLIVPNGSTDKKVDFRVVIDCAIEGKTLEDLVGGMCERAVYDLAYKKWQDRRLRLQAAFKTPFLNDPDFQRLQIMSADRNIYIHNKGIVNEKYLKDVEGLASPTLGEQLTVSNVRFFEAFAATKAWSLEIDHAAILQSAVTTMNNCPDQAGRA